MKNRLEHTLWEGGTGMLRKTSQMCLAALAVMAMTGALQAQTDIFSVNFYAYGKGGAEFWGQEEWRETVRLEPTMAAGMGDWNTIGWQNYLVPWNPLKPTDPITITSSEGSTATFTFNDCRNGGPYGWTAVRTTLIGDGNGNLMDGHVNSTDDPYDETNKFEMVVSDIPFASYDVIIYMGFNPGQFGDGTGKIVFNGGDEQDFTVVGPAIFDGTFTEIVDDVTPGNYIVFEEVTGSSFTTKMWGNGFNHLGPYGFQFRAHAAGPEPMPGDANNNGFVDDDDLAILLSNWEQDPGTVTTWALGDFTADTDVDDDDLAVLLGNWTGAPAAGAAVPEPISAILLLLGAPLVARRRRRH